MSVICSTQHQESVSKKKSNSICHHAVHESVVIGELLMAHNESSDNVADLLAKVVYSAERRILVREVMYDIYDEH